MLQSTVKLGVTLNRAVGDRRGRGRGQPAPGSRLTDRVVLLGVYRSVNERKKGLREVASQTVDLAAGSIRPFPTGSAS